MFNMMGGYETGEGSAPKKRSKPRFEVWDHLAKLDVDGGTRANVITVIQISVAPKEQPPILAVTLHLAVKSQNKSEHSFQKKPKRKIISKPLVKAKKQKRAGINQPPTIALTEAVRTDITSEKIWEVQVKNAILADFPFAHSNIKKAWSSLMVMDMEKEICAYYQRQKRELISELGNLTSCVSFSCEIIEAGWISISAHFINDDFKLVKTIIGFKKVDFETLISCKVDIIERCISDWKLENKIFSINTMLDNDLHNFLKEKFSTKSFLKKKDMVFLCLREKTAKVYLFRLDFCVDKDEIKFLRNALETKEKMKTFNAIAIEMELSPIDENWFKRLAMGWQWETRAWKSCCSAAKLFKDALVYKAVFDKCALTKTGEALVSEVDPQIISWEDMEDYTAASDVFNNIMGTLSSFKHPTSNLFFPSIAKIMDESYLGIDADLCGDIPDIFYVSCALDPRYKLKFLEYYFNQYNQLGDVVDTCYETRELFETLFVAHAREGTNNGDSSSSAGIDDTQEDNSLHIPTCEDDLTKGFRLYLKNLKTSEVNQYLIEDIVDIGDANFDVLEWWKENSLRYPVLSRMARTLVAVPVCLYSVEENLGLGLTVLEGVDPELVEAFICSKDWILTNA